MIIPQSIIFFWPSTNATIPSGWQRETALDTYHIHAATGDTAGTTGGASTHNHWITNATHSFSAGAGVGTQTYLTTGLIYIATSVTHTHSAVNSSTTDFNSGTANNTIAYFKVIFIKPADFGRKGVPAGACAFYDYMIAAVPWTTIADTDEKFLLGADVGGDGGDFDTTPFHNHSVSHGHTQTGSSVPSDSGIYFDTGRAFAIGDHKHLVALSSTTLAAGSTFTEPAWEKLLLIKNGGADEAIMDGIIGVYLGALADIPQYWSQKTFSGDFIKVTTNGAEIGDTGGATQHAHSMFGTAHTHTASISAGVSAIGNASITANTRSTPAHTHTWTVSTTTDSMANCDVKEAYPSYKEVIFVRYNAPPASFVFHIPHLDNGPHPRSRAGFYNRLELPNI